MSIPGFARASIANFRKICSGSGARNKLRLLGIAMLQSIPKTIKRIFGLDENIEEIVEKLWKGTVIEKDGIKYTLIDYESFDIIEKPESFMLTWLKPEKGEVFVDIGAHIGLYTLSMAKLVGAEGIVVAVEPNPINYQTLQNNIKLNNIRNVVALNFASWDRECALKLFTGHVAGHHSVKMNWKLGWFEVKAKKMDNVLKEYCNGRVNWIKIDVEGAEWEVLCGLKETIKKYKPKIIAEVSYENMDKVKSFMEEQGYGLIKISPAFEGMIYGFFRKYIYFLFLPLSSQESTTLP